MEEENDLFESHMIVDGYIEGFMNLYNLPFDEWPEEFKSIAGVNPELLGSNK